MDSSENWNAADFNVYIASGVLGGAVLSVSGAVLGTLATYVYYTIVADSKRKEILFYESLIKKICEHYKQQHQDQLKEFNDQNARSITVKMLSEKLRVWKRLTAKDAESKRISAKTIATQAAKAYLKRFYNNEYLDIDGFNEDTAIFTALGKVTAMEVNSNQQIELE